MGQFVPKLRNEEIRPSSLGGSSFSVSMQLCHNDSLSSIFVGLLKSERKSVTMKLSIFKQKPPITQATLKDIYPKLSDKDIRQIDWKIKKSIAKDNNPSKILEYIKRELSNKNLGKHKFNQNCSKLEEIYTESNKRWMFQENLFCFFSLIISLVWMCTQLIKLYNHDTWATSDCAQYGLYLLFTCLFLVMSWIRKKHKMESFNTFLNLLNRHAPGAIVVGMTLCYCVLCFTFELWISSVLIVVSMLLLIFSIIITLVKM